MDDKVFRGRPAAHVVNDDCQTFLAKAFGDGFADAARGSGDEGDALGHASKL